jgi:hypothetical protein
LKRGWPQHSQDPQKFVFIISIALPLDVDRNYVKMSYETVKRARSCTGNGFFVNNVEI